MAFHTLELIHMDFLTIESGKTGKDVKILVVTDHFTQYAQAFVTPSQTAPVVPQTLWDKFFMDYGLPEKILSDQGHNFKSKLVTELCELSKFKSCEPHHTDHNVMDNVNNPMPLISMIGTLPTVAKSNWKEQLSTLVHAYNCSHSNAMGFSPFYVMFGRHPMLPIDVQFGVGTKI